MGFRDYSESFKAPLPAFPRTEVGLDKLIAAWEKLRELDLAGYRTSQGNGKSAFLVRIACGDGTLGPSDGNGVSCSPFTATALMMALRQGRRVPLHFLQRSDQHPLGGAGFGVSIGGCTQHLKKAKDDAETGQPRYEVLKTPFFEDEEENVRRGAWVTWLSEAEAKKIDL